jgi:hypothetical protein
MKQLQMSPGEMAQISTLISNLTRAVELLHFDIDFEEERARIRDLSDPAYPILARHLRTRRENLMETIAELEARAGSVGSLGDGQSAQLASFRWWSSQLRRRLRLYSLSRSSTSKAKICIISRAAASRSSMLSATCLSRSILTSSSCRSVGWPSRRPASIFSVIVLACYWSN